MIAVITQYQTAFLFCIQGALEILQDIDNIDLSLMYCGTVCRDEGARIKRLARVDCLKLPKFLQNIESYRQQLRWIGYINGLLPKPQVHRPKGT